MHYALQRVCPDAEVLDAFDVNHAANAVYQHNFGRAPRQVSTQLLHGSEVLAQDMPARPRGWCHCVACHSAESDRCLHAGCPSSKLS